MKNVKFEPGSLEISGGEKTQVVINNTDLIVHTFTLKKLDMDFVVGPDSEVLIQLPEIPPGLYTYTCQVTGHEDMEGKLVVTE